MEHADYYYYKKINTRNTITDFYQLKSTDNYASALHFSNETVDVALLVEGESIEDVHEIDKIEFNYLLTRWADKRYHK